MELLRVGCFEMKARDEERRVEAGRKRGVAAIAYYNSVRLRKQTTCAGRGVSESGARNPTLTQLRNDLLGRSVGGGACPSA